MSSQLIIIILVVILVVVYLWLRLKGGKQKEAAPSEVSMPEQPKEVVPPTVTPSVPSSTSPQPSSQPAPPEEMSQPESPSEPEKTQQ